MIAKSWGFIAERVDPKWMPRLSNPLFDPWYRPDMNYRVSFTLEEYGCGVYGCVYPTVGDDAVVMKITTDSTEPEFVRDILPVIDTEISVAYYKVLELPVRDPESDRVVFAIWRQAASDVGRIAEIITNDYQARDTAFLLGLQHGTARKVWKVLVQHGELRSVDWYIDEYVRLWTEMAQSAVPPLREIATQVLAAFASHHVFFGDLHQGNLGIVGTRWVIVDPGQIAVIT